MNRLLLIILLLLAWLILGSLFIKNKLCGVSTTTEKTTAVVPPTNTSRLLIEDGNAFRTTAQEHFDFKESNFNYISPLAKDVAVSLEKTATYLNANPTRSLIITGLYSDTETNNSVFPTLGLARANEVKNALVALGVSGKQLLTGDQLLGTATKLEKGVLLSGVKFSFAKTVKDVSERLIAIKEKFEANPITIYFPTGENVVKLTPEQKQDFADLVFYLDNVEKSSIEVGGHTDNKGDLSINTRLSRKRAEFVRDYLVGNGLVSNRLTAQGYGPNQPIATNNTTEGRAKNRRVEVRLKG